MNVIQWQINDTSLVFSAGEDAPVALLGAPGEFARDVTGQEFETRHTEPQYLVEILAVGHGRAFTSTRLTQSAIGNRLRYTGHTVAPTAHGELLIIEQKDEKSGLVVEVMLESFGSANTVRASTKVSNTSQTTVHLTAVTSLALGNLGNFLSLEDPALWEGRSEWCAESRWEKKRLRDLVPDMDTIFHKHLGRGTYHVTSTSTWSTGYSLPLAVLEDEATGRAFGWQVEHNGPWHWEINSRFFDNDYFTLSLSGPNDLEHAWEYALEPQASFTSVSASFTWSDQGKTGVFQNFTSYRRNDRPFESADAKLPLIFNDYMNALMGDPTTEKLVPLIDAAAESGVEVFCIDCGWYDDGGYWWPSVGAWQPSKKRFGEAGLEGVLAYIREKGMAPGLWIEAEVVGVLSDVAKTLPDSAFMTRHGVRIEEHNRYFLDMRSPDARKHLDDVFKRLVEDYGVRYFKWDYNVTPGAGPADASTSAGYGLLEHSRALQEWISALRTRYPDVILEACSSGAQRMDHSTVRQYDLQSTSDQQNFLLYPTIAAAAPAMLIPERAGNWAYPQGDDSAETVAFNLVTGLSGRLYLSGHLNELPQHCMELVSEATAIYRQVITATSQSLPIWPTDLPHWEAPFVSLGAKRDDEIYVFAWSRDDHDNAVALALSDFAGQEIEVETVFPKQLPAWETQWNKAAGELTVTPGGTEVSARILRITVK